MTRLLAAYKYLISFRKREWSIGDYPVRIRRQPTDSASGAPPWLAQIINWWWLAGSGDTPQQALDDLKRNLDARRAQGPLPRPGSRVAIQFAAVHEIARHGEFAYEFVDRVVGIRPMFMSDQTSLGDFCGLEGIAGVHRKVALLYGVDSRGLAGEPLWKVLDLVRASGVAAEHGDEADEVR